MPNYKQGYYRRNRNRIEVWLDRRDYENCLGPDRAFVIGSRPLETLVSIAKVAIATDGPPPVCSCVSAGEGFHYTGVRGIIAHLNDDGSLPPETVVLRCNVCKRFASDGEAESFLRTVIRARKRRDNVVSLVNTITAFEQGELEHEEVLELFQYLVDTGMAWRLQGFYGRAAKNLLCEGEIIDIREAEDCERAERGKDAK